MDNPSTLRLRAAHFFEAGAAAATPAEAAKLNAVGCQLELWADDLEERQTYQNKVSGKDSDPSAPSKNAQGKSTRS